MAPVLQLNLTSALQPLPQCPPRLDTRPAAYAYLPLPLVTNSFIPTPRNMPFWPRTTDSYPSALAPQPLALNDCPWALVPLPLVLLVSTHNSHCPIGPGHTGPIPTGLFTIGPCPTGPSSIGACPLDRYYIDPRPIVPCYIGPRPNSSYPVIIEWIYGGVIVAGPSEGAPFQSRTVCPSYFKYLGVIQRYQ